MLTSRARNQVKKVTWSISRHQGWTYDLRKSSVLRLHLNDANDEDDVTVGCSMLEPLPQGMHDRRVSSAEIIYAFIYLFKTFITLAERLLIQNFYRAVPPTIWKLKITVENNRINNRITVENKKFGNKFRVHLYSLCQLSCICCEAAVRPVLARMLNVSCMFMMWPGSREWNDDDDDLIHAWFLLFCFSESIVLHDFCCCDVIRFADGFSKWKKLNIQIQQACYNTGFQVCCVIGVITE